MVVRKIFLVISLVQATALLNAISTVNALRTHSITRINPNTGNLISQERLQQQNQLKKYRHINRTPHKRHAERYIYSDSPYIYPYNQLLENNYARTSSGHGYTNSEGSNFWQVSNNTPHAIVISSKNGPRIRIPAQQSGQVPHPHSFSLEIETDAGRFLGSATVYDHNVEISLDNDDNAVIESGD